MYATNVKSMIMYATLQWAALLACWSVSRHCCLSDCLVIFHRQLSNLNKSYDFISITWGKVSLWMKKKDKLAMKTFTSWLSCCSPSIVNVDHSLPDNWTRALAHDGLERARRQRCLYMQIRHLDLTQYFYTVMTPMEIMYCNTGDNLHHPATIRLSFKSSWIRVDNGHAQCEVNKNEHNLVPRYFERTSGYPSSS